ncbi:unnamed protein product [Calypogeia fissa]
MLMGKCGVSKVEAQGCTSVEQYCGSKYPSEPLTMVSMDWKDAAFTGAALESPKSASLAESVVVSSMFRDLTSLCTMGGSALC